MTGVVTIPALRSRRAAGSLQHVSSADGLVVCGSRPVARHASISAGNFEHALNPPALVPRRGFLRLRSAMKRCAVGQTGAGWATRDATRFLLSSNSTPLRCRADGVFSSVNCRKSRQAALDWSAFSRVQSSSPRLIRSRSASLYEVPNSISRQRRLTSASSSGSRRTFFLMRMRFCSLMAQNIGAVRNIVNSSCNADVRNIRYGDVPHQEVSDTMDFLFSPLAGLVTAFVLQGGPILPSAADFSGWTTRPVEQHAAAPVMAPSIDRILLLPDGFRAPGYEALTISKAGN